MKKLWTKRFQHDEFSALASFSICKKNLKQLNSDQVILSDTVPLCRLLV